MRYWIIIGIGLISLTACETKYDLAYAEAEPLCESVRKRLARNDGRFKDLSEDFCDCMTDKIADEWADRYERETLEKLSGVKKAGIVTKTFLKPDIQNSIAACAAASAGLDERESKEAIETVRNILPGI